MTNQPTTSTSPTTNNKNTKTTKKKKGGRPNWGLDLRRTALRIPDVLFRRMNQIKSTEGVPVSTQVGTALYLLEQARRSTGLKTADLALRMAEPMWLLILSDREWKNEDLSVALGRMALDLRPSRRRKEAQEEQEEQEGGCSADDEWCGNPECEVTLLAPPSSDGTTPPEGEKKKKGGANQ